MTTILPGLFSHVVGFDFGEATSRRPARSSPAASDDWTNEH